MTAATGCELGLAVAFDDAGATVLIVFFVLASWAHHVALTLAWVTALYLVPFRKLLRHSNFVWKIYSL